MISWLNKIRRPSKLSLSLTLMNASAFILLGTLLGLVSKLLDQTPSNRLPIILMSLDLRNFFSRLAIWMLMALIIALYTKSPLRAALYVGAFFVSSLSAYYLYTIYVANFVPKQAMLLWFSIALISPICAFGVWYAKGEGVLSKVIAVLVFVIISRQVFPFGVWYIDVAKPLELMVWIAMLISLYQSRRQLVEICLFGTVVFILLMPVSLIFGIL